MESESRNYDEMTEDELSGAQFSRGWQALESESSTYGVTLAFRGIPGTDNVDAAPRKVSGENEAEAMLEPLTQLDEESTD